MRSSVVLGRVAVAAVLACSAGASALAQNNSGISPYGAQAYPYNPKPAPAQTPAPTAQAPISPYGSQTYPAQPRGPNDPISPYGAQAYPYRPQAAAPAGQAAPQRAQPAAAAVAQARRAPQVAGAYSLEDQGAWRRVEGMPASMGNPTQLAAGTYAAPPVPAGTVFKNSGIPPLTRPKSAVHPPANRYSDLYGMYPQNVVGTWVLNTGGQWGMSLQGPDRNGQQEYTYGGVTGAGLLKVDANGTWTLQFAGKTQTGRWADAPDTVHFFNLDGEEQFAYWNNKGQLLLQGESGKLKTSVNGKA